MIPTRREDLLDRIVRWEEARAQGSPLSPEELCRDSPELCDDLRREVERLAEVAWLDEPIGETSSWASAPAPGSAAGPPPGLPAMLAGRYRLDEPIGEGGFGRVFRGFDTWLERPVALKVPRIDRPVSDPELDLCRLEARKAARLRHPHIVPVHDVGRDGGTCFIVSEWIEGADLASRLRSGRPPYPETARILAEVADALHFAHARGFVHRDVKPANILLDRQGVAYLTDFGIAVVEEELLGNVAAAGTLPYMAPEQLAAIPSGPVDHRADIHALGVVLYEALTGRRPFLAPSPLVLREQILESTPAPPRALAADVPEPLERVCLRCLAKRPEDRYPEAGIVAGELRAFRGTAST